MNEKINKILELCSEQQNDNMGYDNKNIPFDDIITLSEIDPININDLESKSKAHNDDFNRVRADLIHSNDILTESIKSALLQFNDSKLPAYLLGIAQLSKSLNANSQSLIDLYKTKESKSNNNKVNESSYVVEDISTILNQQIKLN